MQCWFQISDNDKVEVCPVHLQIAKGPKTSQYVYQLVPTKSYAVVHIQGSCNTGPTPEQFEKGGAVKHLYACGPVNHIQKYIRAAKNGIISKVFKDMCNRAVGRRGTYWYQGFKMQNTVELITYAVEEAKKLGIVMGYPQLPNN